MLANALDEGLGIEILLVILLSVFKGLRVPCALARHGFRAMNARTGELTDQPDELACICEQHTSAKI